MRSRQGTTPVFVVFVPLWIHACAGAHQSRDDFAIAPRCGISHVLTAPAINRPPERRAVERLILRIDRRTALEQQLDRLRVAAVRGPVQARLSVMLEPVF